MTIILPNHNLVFFQFKIDLSLQYFIINLKTLIFPHGKNKMEREDGSMYLNVHIDQKIYADMNVFMDRIHLNKDKYWNVRTIQHH